MAEIKRRAESQPQAELRALELGHRTQEVEERTRRGAEERAKHEVQEAEDR